MGSLLSLLFLLFSWFCIIGVVASTRAPVRFLLVCAVQRALDACLLWIHGTQWRVCIIIAWLPIARRVLLSCSDVLFGFFMVLLYSGAVPLVCLVFLFFCFKGLHHLHTPHNPYQTYYIIKHITSSKASPFIFPWAPRGAGTIYIYFIYSEILGRFRGPPDAFWTDFEQWWTMTN